MNKTGSHAEEIADLKRRVGDAENVIKAFRDFTGWPIGSAHGDKVRKAFSDYVNKYGARL